MSTRVKVFAILSLLAAAGVAWLASPPGDPVTRATPAMPERIDFVDEHAPPPDGRAGELADLLQGLANAQKAHAQPPDTPPPERAPAVPLPQRQQAAPAVQPEAVLDGAPLTIERPGAPFADLYQAWSAAPEDREASRQLGDTLNRQIGDIGLAPLSMRASCRRALCRIVGVMASLDELEELRHLPYAEDNARLAYAQPQLLDEGVMLVVYDRLEH